MLSVCGCAGAVCQSGTQMLWRVRWRFTRWDCQYLEMSSRGIRRLRLPSINHLCLVVDTKAFLVTYGAVSCGHLLGVVLHSSSS